MNKRILTALLAIVMMLSLFSACAPAPADNTEPTEGGQTIPSGGDADEKKEEPGDEEKPAPDEGRAAELLAFLEGITANEGVAEDEVEPSLKLFAEYLAEHEEAFSGDVPADVYYKRAVLEYQPVVDFVRIRLFYPDYPMVDTALEGSDSLYIGDEGLADTGASGHYDSDYSGIIGETEDALLYYRRREVDCPLGMEWCKGEYTHWDMELCFYDFATDKRATIVSYEAHSVSGKNLSLEGDAPDTVICQNTDFKFIKEADGGYYISYVFSLPHSDQGWRSEGFFERMNPVYVENERIELGV